MQPTLSIIVPVYKVEKYLQECIDSILAQTFSNFELILVDDGSPDQSGAICDKYALKDNRVLAIHKPNGGVSSARNLGLEKARGEWVTFIDSDDFISPTYIEGLYAPIAKGEQLDLVHGGCTNWKNGKPAGINQLYEDYIGDEPDIVFEKFRGLTFSKLFRLENVKTWADGQGLRFDENMRIAEDMAFTLDYLLTVKRYAFVSEVGYYYRIDNMTSATKQRKLPVYNQVKVNFEHLRGSIFKYIQTNNLTTSQTCKRMELLSLSLFNLIKSIYYIPKINKKNRLLLIRDILSENKGLLNHLSRNRRDYKYAYFLIQERYNLFDIIMLAKSYIYSNT